MIALSGRLSEDGSSSLEDDGMNETALIHGRTRFSEAAARLLAAAIDTLVREKGAGPVLVELKPLGLAGNRDLVANALDELAAMRVRDETGGLKWAVPLAFGATNNKQAQVFFPEFVLERVRRWGERMRGADDILYALRMVRPYPINLYLVLRDADFSKSDTNEIELNLDVLRRELRVPKASLRMPDDFYQFCVHKSIETINEHTDLKFAVEPVRGARRAIVGARFKLESIDKPQSIYRPIEVAEKPKRKPRTKRP